MNYMVLHCIMLVVSSDETNEKLIIQRLTEAFSIVVHEKLGQCV